MHYKEYTNSHKPIIRQTYVDTHKIWNKPSNAVSKELTQRVMKILRGGKQ